MLRRFNRTRMKLRKVKSACHFLDLYVSLGLTMGNSIVLTKVSYLTMNSRRLSTAFFSNAMRCMVLARVYASLIIAIAIPRPVSLS